MAPRTTIPALLLVLLALSGAERLDFDLLLPATSSSIHYTDFYLRGPSASIDMSGLVLTAVSEAKYYSGVSGTDDNFDEGGDDDEEDDDQGKRFIG
jgi:hypothetical protein